MKFTSLLLTVSLFGALDLCADEKNKEPLTKAEVGQLLTLVGTKSSPNVYGAIYYPRWKEAIDGLKSVTAEAIAEEANEKMKGGVRLELVGEVVEDDEVAGVLLKRSGGGLEEGIFPAYLYRDDRNGWGFLGFPIPYKAPIFLGKDWRFREKALNDPTPYDGVLYEFDQETQARFAAITKKLEAAQAAGAGGAAAGQGEPGKHPGAEKAMAKIVLKKDFGEDLKFHSREVVTMERNDRVPGLNGLMFMRWKGDEPGTEVMASVQWFEKKKDLLAFYTESRKRGGFKLGEFEGTALWKMGDAGFLWTDGEHFQVSLGGDPAPPAEMLKAWLAMIGSKVAGLEEEAE